MTTSNSPETKSRRSPAAIILAIGVVAVCGSIVLAATIVTRGCTATAARSVDKLKDLFSIKTTVETHLDGTVDALQKRAKLVVQEANITAEVSKSETYQWWIVYFGKTTANVRAKGCKVQYVVNLNSFTKSNIEEAETADHQRILRIWLPEPTVDEDIVEVNYDQLEVQSSSGWARFNKGEVAEEAKKLLRQAAVDRAKNNSNIRLAEDDAVPAVRKLLGPLAEALQPDVKLEIQFRQSPLP